MKPRWITKVALMALFHSISAGSFGAGESVASTHSRTVSGTPFRGAVVESLALQYPGACQDRSEGDWLPPVIHEPSVGEPNSCSSPCTVTAGCTSNRSNCPVEIQGSDVPTPDYCSPSKSLPSDWMYGFPDTTGTFHLTGNTDGCLELCTFPVPAGTGAVVASWNQYLDMPRFSGFVQLSEYRFFKNGAWSGWRNTSPSGTLRSGAKQYWSVESDELAEAAQADSVQVRYCYECVPFLAYDHENCGDVVYGVLYDDFTLFVITGIPPAPVFGVLPVALPQTTFVDGTMAGTNCSLSTVNSGACWPGIRGSDVVDMAQPERDIHDNVNSPIGDSVVVAIVSPLRTNGMGVNWRFGYDKSVNGGETIAHTNGSYNSAYDVPRVIYRLFDPTTKTWSPFDSSALDADDVVVGASDTTLTRNSFRMVWPPRDKVGLSLPGGFTISGHAQYSELAFLPRGTRLQYYFKAVDIQGNRVYRFQSDNAGYELEDLPTLPGSSIKAPDIIEFDVLPGVYPPGPAGTQLAGRTNTPLLNLDGAYTAWSYGVDPVTQALRALGVRADRYRLLQGLDYGNNIGGHEFAGTRFGQLTNYFPNMDEYVIKDSLAGWYFIMIESSHTSTTVVPDQEPAAKLIKEWWEAPTAGSSGGDRCIFASGDDYFSTLTAPGMHPNEIALAGQVFGVGAAASQWNGGSSEHFPAIRDRFADPAAGPGLGAPGDYQYLVDGGCPIPNRFDALTNNAPALRSALYPTFGGITNAAALSNMTERDPAGDHDRNKALGYGFSIQFIRHGGQNMVDTRAQVLYKFLTSCRGPRGALDTTSCWPCPTDANKYGNWATLTGFQTSTYGPLYPIQDATKVLTSVESPTLPGVNALLQNRPNPFNPETVIPYSLASPGRVAVRIYDARGRLVRTLVDAVQPAGFHTARWSGSLEDGRRAASGIYFYRIEFANGSTGGKKMVLLR